MVPRACPIAGRLLCHLIRKVTANLIVSRYMANPPANRDQKPDDSSNACDSSKPRVDANPFTRKQRRKRLRRTIKTRIVESRTGIVLALAGGGLVTAFDSSHRHCHRVSIREMETPEGTRTATSSRAFILMIAARRRFMS
jgi:hypothetical protein